VDANTHRKVQKMMKRTHRFPRRAGLTLAVLALASLAGCSDLTGPEIRGTYDMVSFGGHPIGTEVAVGNGTMIIHRADLTLARNQRFTLNVERRFCQVTCEEEDFAETGIFNMPGPTFLILLADAGGRIEGLVEGGQITLFDGAPGSVWVRR
jgi:hypothetical protein